MSISGTGISSPDPALNSVRARKIFLLILVICLLLLQVAAISQRSYWEDEAATAYLASMDYGKIIQARAADNHPPLYWLSVAAWGRVFGTSEWSLKSYSLVWLVSAVLLAYKLAGKLYDDRTALIAVALMVFSPYVLTYGHNARYYAMSAAMSVFLALMAKNYLERGRWVDLFFYICGSVALMYTFYMGATVVIALNLWYLSWAIKRKTLTQFIVGWLLAQFVIAMSYLPWISTLIATAGRNLDGGLVVGNLVLELLIRFGYIGYAYLSGEFLSPLNPLVWLLILSFVLITFSALRSVLNSDGLPLSVVVVCLILSVVVNLVSVYPQSAWQNLSNRTFYVYPFFLIWLAGNIGSLRPKFTYLSLGVFFLVYSAGVFNYFNDVQMVKPLLAVPWQSMLQGIQAQKSPDAVVLCSGGDFACNYYLEQFDLSAPDPWSRERLLDQPPPDLWWIQINLGAPRLQNAQTTSFVDRLRRAYQQYSFSQYAPQDRSIRQIKTKFFKHVDYEARVTVYHFSMPVQP